MATQSETGPLKSSMGDEQANSGEYEAVKVETNATPSSGRAGAVITYETTISNLTDEPISGLQLTDSLIGTFDHSPEWPQNTIDLEPNQSVTFSRSVVLSAEKASSQSGFTSTTTVQSSGKNPIAVEGEHTLKIDSMSSLSPSDIENLSALAGHAQLFIRPRFGGLEQVGDLPQRTVASFDEMSLEDDMADGVKNHLVTLGFRDLSRVLLGYTHPVESNLSAQALAEAGDKLLANVDGRTWPDANFCAFGAWASLTIGRNVRNRFAPRRFDQSTTNAFRGAFSRLAIDVRQTNKQRLSKLLAAAQRLVFDELFRSIEGLLQRTSDLETDFDQALAQLTASRPGGVRRADDRRELLELYAKVEPILAKAIHDYPFIEPNQVARAKKGHDERYADLVHGLVSYFLARQAHKAGAEEARSELIFRGNVLIESYVQIKVQQVLDYSVDEIASDYFKQQIGVEESENRGAGRWRRRMNRAASQRFEKSFGDVWGRVLTDQVLVARVGDEVIRLGRDLPDPPGSSSFFPPALNPICDRWANNLLLRFDHSFGYGTGTRSHNWGVYDDRMNWLVNLLRSRQQSMGIWKEPFTLQEEVLVRAHQDPTDGIPGGSPWTR